MSDDSRCFKYKNKTPTGSDRPKGGSDHYESHSGLSTNRLNPLIYWKIVNLFDNVRSTIMEWKVRINCYRTLLIVYCFLNGLVAQ